MNVAAEPTPPHAPALHAALLDYFSAPGNYQLALRQPVLLFASVRDILQIAAGRGGADEGGGAENPAVRDAAVFFLRAALLYPGADHYAVLGFPARSEPVQLKERYRLLMRLIHPDFAAAAATAWPGDAAVRVNRAYEVLSSPVLRRSYDEQLSALRSQRPPAPAMADVRRTASVPRGADNGRRQVNRKAAWALAAGVGLLGVLILLPRSEPEGLVQKSTAPPRNPQRLALATDDQVLEPVGQDPADSKGIVLAPSLPAAPSVPADVPSRVAAAAPSTPPVPPAPSGPAPAAIQAVRPPAAVAPATPVASAAPVQPLAPAVLAAPVAAPQPRPAAVARAVPAPEPAPAPTPAQIVAPATPARPAAEWATASVPAPVRPAPTPRAPDPVARPVPAPAGAAVVATTAPLLPEPEPAPAPAPARIVPVVAVAPSPTLADAQPLLTQLLQMLESGSGEQLLWLLEGEARHAPPAQALVRQYEQMVRGERPVRLTHVEFKGEPRDGVLLVTGRIRLHAGEPTIGSHSQRMLVRAEFVSRGGHVMLKGLSGASD